MVLSPSEKSYCQHFKQAKDKPFFLYFSTHDAHEPRIANTRYRGSSGCGIYGDVVQQFDYSVGEVVKALKNAGVYDNTIIIISSDNGPRIKEAYDDGATENMNGHDPYAGMRGLKYTIYEGGLRLPFVFSWPDKIRKGRTEQRPVCLANIWPTIATLTGNPLPKEQWADAQNDAEIYLNTKNSKENPVFMQSGDASALTIRYKGWKFVRYLWAEELFDLTNDLGEKNSVIAQNAEKANELRSMLDNFKNK